MSIGIVLCRRRRKYELGYCVILGENPGIAVNLPLSNRKGCVRELWPKGEVFMAFCLTVLFSSSYSTFPLLPPHLQLPQAILRSFSLDFLVSFNIQLGQILTV